MKIANNLANSKNSEILTIYPKKKVFLKGKILVTYLPPRVVWQLPMHVHKTQTISLNNWSACGIWEFRSSSYQNFRESLTIGICRSLKSNCRQHPFKWLLSEASADPSKVQSLWCPFVPASLPRCKQRHTRHYHFASHTRQTRSFCGFGMNVPNKGSLYSYYISLSLSLGTYKLWARSRQRQVQIPAAAKRYYCRFKG